MSRNDVLAYARRDLGVQESPPHSNHSSITEWYNKNVENLGYSWAGCEAGVTKWMWTGGAKSLKRGRAYTVWGAQDYQSGVNGGTWHWGTDNIQPGDQVYFDWSGRKKDISLVDHTGIVEVVNTNQTFYTIENNTSYDDCRRMLRDEKYVVGYGRPAWARLSPGTPSKPKPKPSPVSVKAQKVYELQLLLETPRDWQWGPKTDQLVMMMRAAARRKLERGLTKKVQAIINTKIDGAWGPNSDRALIAWVKKFQRLLGVTADGSWGPKTEAAFKALRKKYLNNY